MANISAGGPLSGAFRQAFASTGDVAVSVEVAPRLQVSQTAAHNSCQRTFDLPSFVVSSAGPSVTFPTRGAITTTVVVNGGPVGADAAAVSLPWLVVNHIKREFLLFGQPIEFHLFKHYCLKVFLALCNWPSLDVLDDDLFAEANLRGQVSNLAKYISGGIRPILRPIVENYGPAARRKDAKYVKNALIINKPKTYGVAGVRTRYRLDIPADQVLRVYAPTDLASNPMSLDPR